MNFKFVFLGLATLSVVSSAPAPSALSPGAVTPVSITPFTPFAQFARAAYCSKLQGWNCGPACKALPGFVPSVIGGNGKDVPIYFVGYWPPSHTIVVAHQGTDPTSFLSLLTDAKIAQKPLNATLFPGVSSRILIHQGFGIAHAATADSVLSEVKKLMAEKNTTSVTTVGHSLGGALAELDALFLVLNLPSETDIKGVTYGTPRVGNAAFVQAFDSKVLDFKRINNNKDPIPIVPPRFLNFQHPEGEIHISPLGAAVSCPGADNTADPECSNQVVTSVLRGSILDHLGPYDGVRIGTPFCLF